MMNGPMAGLLKFGCASSICLKSHFVTFIGNCNGIANRTCFESLRIFMIHNKNGQRLFSVFIDIYNLLFKIINKANTRLTNITQHE